MMEEDYVDPAGGKPDIVAETRDSITRIYTRETVLFENTAETRKDEKVGETNLQVSLVDSSPKRVESAGRSCVVLLLNFGANIFSSPFSWLCPASS